jgi:hypothetical protein
MFFSLLLPPHFISFPAAILSRFSASFFPDVFEIALLPPRFSARFLLPRPLLPPPEASFQQADTAADSISHAFLLIIF